MSAYPEGHVERFAAARSTLYSLRVSGQVSLQLEGKVRMTLEEYEAIAADIAELRLQVEQQQNTIDAVRGAVQ